ncbi:unnamed protein product [Prorocentrum cordatum]|uniref:H(+)-exporting diphosphatase n=1 Tax=Prorocentrum cordatum TaxID=2364126 RepID=A0ABN9USD0_9DINO|nr:unnamed protein product [Polarella glacialis]
MSQRVRYWIALADDGAMDQYEALWDKFVADLEGGVLNMSASHLSIQAIRAVISGDMPLFNGTNPPGFQAQHKDSVELFLMAVVFGIAMVIVNLMQVRFRGTELKITKSRLKGTLGNCIAFCLLWSLNWSIGRTLGVHGVVGGMVLALVVTMLGMFLIVALDQLADLECTSEKFDEELYAFCPCIAILIGFSWKQAFTTSVGTLTQQTHYLDPAIETLILTACLVTVVIPAWKLYILPVILEPELAAIKKTMPDVEQPAPAPAADAHLEGENAVRLSIAGTAQYDVKTMQEAEEQKDPSRAEGLHAALLQGRGPASGLLRRRNEELELAIAHIRGLCSTAGAAQRR